VRTATGANVLYYNTTTKEITYDLPLPTWTLRAENFVFGAMWTPSQPPVGIAGGVEVWLFPGTHLLSPTLAGNIIGGGHVPSMAVAYNSAVIATAAVHLLNPGAAASSPNTGWWNPPIPFGAFTIQVYKFCEITEDGIPIGDHPVLLGEVTGTNWSTCNCMKADTAVGCDTSTFLAVSMKFNNALAYQTSMTGRNLSISVALHSQTALLAPF